MVELLEWLQLLSDLARKTVEPNASNIILSCYLLVYIFNRKSCFIAAFLFSEFVANTGALDILPDATYYLFFAGLYCLLYHYFILINEKIKTIFACVIIVLFNVWSALDVTFYPQVETVFYKAYVYFVVAVHLYLIGTLINWKLLWINLGKSFNWLLGLLGDSYTVQLYCYTFKNQPRKGK